MTLRLNKILARAGVAYRRGADRLIVAGRVTVNGAVVRKLGTCVDPRRDAVKVDGRGLSPVRRSHTYLALNKPRGFVTTLSDPQGRPTVRDLLQGVRGRIFPIGRLDLNSEGLLLFTDDGDLAVDLMHPRSSVRKTYAVKVRGRVGPETLGRLGRGIKLDGRLAQPARVVLLRAGDNSWLEVTVVEGRKHQVRRMLLAVGHPVVKLRRVRYDGVELGPLPRGKWRRLTGEEVGRLRRAIKRGSGDRPGSGRGARCP